MCKSIAKQVATLFEALSTVIAQRDSSNNAVEITFPVLPSMLVATRGREFTSMIQKHRRRLLQSMTEAEIEQIEDKFQALKRAYFKEEATKRQIDAGVPNKSFEAAVVTGPELVPLLPQRTDFSLLHQSISW